MSAKKKKPAKKKSAGKKTVKKFVKPKTAKKATARKGAGKKPAPKKPSASKAAKKPALSPRKSVPGMPQKPVEKASAKTPASAASRPAPKPRAPKTSLDDLPLDLEEKEELAEEEKRDLARALADDDGPDATFVPTDTSERYILVVDEEGQRRSETATIISQILPNAVIEVADDPEEALEMMQDCEFDTFVVNFLMPGYSASPFVKAVANHVDHPLLIGFAADKISDAVDPKKGLKIIPLKRLFDLDTTVTTEPTEGGGSNK